MTDAERLDLRRIDRLRGRALLVDRDGTFYASRRYTVYRSADGGATWTPDFVVPSPAWRAAAAGCSRLGARLLRHYIAALVKLPDGTRVAVARDGVYRAAPGERIARRVWTLPRGSRPLNLGVDARGRVLFGEYGAGMEADEVHVYVSEDGARTFDVGFTFPRAAIRHVHNVQPDPHDADRIWVLTGDFGTQPGIAALRADLTFDGWLVRGSQHARAVSAHILPDALVYGTDSDRERNAIVRVEKASGRTTELREATGSSLFATSFGSTRLIATCVEPNPAAPNTEAVLYASRDGDRWTPVTTAAKDVHHPVLFQFGAIVLPYSASPGEAGMFSGQALRGLDDRIICVTHADR